MELSKNGWSDHFEKAISTTVYFRYEQPNTTPTNPHLQPPSDTHTRNDPQNKEKQSIHLSSRPNKLGPIQHISPSTHLIIFPMGIMTRGRGTPSNIDGRCMGGNAIGERDAINTLLSLRATGIEEWCTIYLRPHRIPFTTIGPPAFCFKIRLIGSIIKITRSCYMPAQYSMYLMWLLSSLLNVVNSPLLRLEDSVRCLTW